MPQTPLSVADLLAKCEEILARAEDACVEFLKPYAQREKKPGEIFACFELHHMQNYALNYNIFSAKEEGEKKILATEWTEATGGASFIPELDTYLSGYFGEVELSPADGEDFTAKHEEQLQNWFARIWKNAGGTSAQLPAYFAFGEDYTCRNLETGEVLSELETAEKLGYSGLSLS